MSKVKKTARNTAKKTTAKKATKKAAKKTGRPQGRKNAERMETELIAAKCPKCGSTNVQLGKTASVQPYRHIVNGEEFTHIRTSRGQCRDCKQQIFVKIHENSTESRWRIFPLGI